jgi:hypothetical protein
MTSIPRFQEDGPLHLDGTCHGFTQIEAAILSDRLKQQVAFPHGLQIHEFMRNHEMYLHAAQ